jgi:hypothetical protein
MKPTLREIAGAKSLFAIAFIALVLIAWGAGLIRL